MAKQKSKAKPKAKAVKKLKQKKAQAVFEKGTIHKHITIVKRGWHIEPYDEKKVYGSCVFACRMAHLSQKEAERIAEEVAPAVTKAVHRKKYVSSDDIFRMIIEHLSKYDPDAAFLYETHRDIS